MKCKNCQELLLDQQKFCANCGAKKIKKRLSFKLALSEFGTNVFSWDNTFFKTLWHLLIKPHIVIKDFIDGVRKKYVNPFSLLLISLSATGILIFLTRDEQIKQLSTFATKSTPEGFMEKIMNVVYDYNTFIVAFFIPVMALVSWIVFKNKKKFNYIEHLIIYLYTYAFTSIFNVIVLTILFIVSLKMSVTLSFFFLFLQFIYTLLVLIKLFNLTFSQVVIKTIYFLFFGLIFYFIISIGIMGSIYIFLGKEQFIETFNLKQ